MQPQTQNGRERYLPYKASSARLFLKRKKSARIEPPHETMSHGSACHLLLSVAVFNECKPRTARHHDGLLEYRSLRRGKLNRRSLHNLAAEDKTQTNEMKCQAAQIFIFSRFCANLMTGRHRQVHQELYRIAAVSCGGKANFLGSNLKTIHRWGAPDE